jgi:hypothetical protein
MKANIREREYWDIVHNMLFKPYGDIDLGESILGIIVEGINAIPDGKYLLIEHYCRNKRCDCRQVRISIVREGDTKTLATYNYGWEPFDFYKTWAKGNQRLAKFSCGLSIADDHASNFAVNFLPVLKNYLEKEVYQKMILDHHNLVRELVDKAEVPLSIKEIIDDLSYFDNSYPLNAMKEAVRQKEKIILEFLKCLQDVLVNYDSIDDAYCLHLPATYLLAEFRVKEAFPLLIAIFSLPDYILDFLYDYTLTEDIHNVIASTYDGNFQLLASLIENKTANEFFRASAIEALQTLYQEGVLSRNEIVNYVGSLFDSRLDKSEQNYVWAGLVHLCMDLELKEFFYHCQSAYDAELVDNRIFNREDIENGILHGIRLIDNAPRCHYITNVVEDMSTWECFQEAETGFLNTVLVKTKNKIGRNDLCHCGSGKKYKKCCMN